METKKGGFDLSGVKASVGRTPRGSGAPPVAAALIFGLLLTASGLLVLGAVHGVVPTDGKMDAPKRVVSIVASVFVLAGLALLGAAARGAAERARRRRVLAERPDEPWLADRAWDRRRETFSHATPFLKAVRGAVFLGVFLVPFNWWAFRSGESPVMVKVITGFFDALLVLTVAHSFLLLLRALRYGRSEVAFGTFPFFPGGEIDASFRRGGNAAFRRLVLTLRCIRERVVRTGTGKNRSVRTEFDTLHEEEVVVGEWDGAAAPGKDVPLRFSLPDDAPSTSLSASPPTYWELEVKGEADGPDFHGTFLIPVYARTRGA